MALNLINSQDTVGRLRWTRKIADANADLVCAVYPLPPGSTVRQIDMNATVVSTKDVEMHKASEYSLHGYFIGFNKSDHGYGSNIGAYDAMWDDLVPKDRDVDDELVNYGADSVVSGNTQIGSPVEGGAWDNDGSGTTSNVGTLVGAWQGPKCWFSRVKRLDVSNGIISGEGKYRAFDKVTSSVNRPWRLARDRYWFLIMGIGAPKFEVVNELGHIPNNDIEWNAIAYPEIYGLQGMIQSGGPDATYGDFWEKHLESAFIMSDTYEDITSTGNTEGGGDLTIFNNLTIRYTRPQMPVMRANSRDGID